MRRCCAPEGTRIWRTNAQKLCVPCSKEAPDGIPRPDAHTMESYRCLRTKPGLYRHQWISSLLTTTKVRGGRLHLRLLSTNPHRHKLKVHTFVGLQSRLSFIGHIGYILPWVSDGKSRQPRGSKLVRWIWEFKKFEDRHAYECDFVRIEEENHLVWIRRLETEDSPVWSFGGHHGMPRDIRHAAYTLFCLRALEPYCQLGLMPNELLAEILSYL